MNKLTNNIILDSDVYKQTHFGFMEPNTTNIFSYIEARKGGEYTNVQFFGLQYYLKKYLTTKITKEMVDEAEKYVTAIVGAFNRKGWDYIVDHCDGNIPLKIKAVKEGTVVPEGNVLVTVENTDPNCAWVTGFFETALLRSVWYGTTVATRAYEFRKVIDTYMKISGDESLSAYKFLDFGLRGVSSRESGEIGGMAAILNHGLSDNIMGMMAAIEYYNAKNIPALSCPASEHSVTTARGINGEKQFISDAIDAYGGEGKLVSLVADSYDLDNFIKLLGVDLKDKIISSGTTVVCRPDSGIPKEIVLHTLTELGKYFGYTINDKGYKVLHPSIRVIQGDGINLESMAEIYENILANGWSAENVTFGCGGYLLQNLTRDTQRFALKASSVVVDGEQRDVFKSPKTDMTKASKAGRITLVDDGGVIRTIKENEINDTMTELLVTVFENGNIIKEYTFEEIRTI